MNLIHYVNLVATVCVLAQGASAQCATTALECRAQSPTEAVSDGPDERLPVPDAAQQESARKKIEEFLQLEIEQADSRAKRTELARKLSDLATRTDDAASRYILLCEARDMALQEADGLAVLYAIDSLVDGFRLDSMSMRVWAMERARANANISAKTMVEAAHIGRSWLEATETVLLEPDVASAEKMIQLGIAAAKRANDRVLHQRFEARRMRLEDLGQLLERGRRAEARLVDNPVDEASNSEYGTYLCVVRHDWAAGAEYLAKGRGLSRNAALCELSKLKDPMEMLDLADKWWSAAMDETGHTQTVFKKHAAKWYANAAPALGGLGEARVGPRLALVSDEEFANGSDDLEPSRRNLVGWWRFDEGEGDRVVDRSGRGNDGWVAGGACWRDGVSGGVLSFDGVDDYVRIDVASELPSSAGPLTVAWYQWVEEYPSNDSQVMISLGAVRPAALNLGFRPGRPGRITPWRRGGEEIVSAPAPPARRWHHYAYTFDGTTSSIYINGKLHGTSNRAPTATPPTRLEFGRFDGTDPDYFKGLLDEIHIYSRVLDKEEIQMLLWPTR